MKYLQQKARECAKEICNGFRRHYQFPDNNDIVIEKQILRYFSPAEQTVESMNLTPMIEIGKHKQGIGISQPSQPSSVDVDGIVKRCCRKISVNHHCLAIWSVDLESVSEAITEATAPLERENEEMKVRFATAMAEEINSKLIAESSFQSIHDAHTKLKQDRDTLKLRILELESKSPLEAFLAGHTRMEKRIKELERVFIHGHINNGIDDTCKQCGLDLRDSTHKRL